MENTILLTTERLLLRPIQIEDADSIFSYRSNAEVNQYQGWIPKSMDDVYHFIKNKVSREINMPCKWFQFVVIKKDDNKLIGDIGIFSPASETFQVEIGCTFNKDYHGKGYATEALTETINYLFDVLNKHQIMVSIDPRNFSSIKLFERLGFRKEAHFKESLFINGEWVDDLVYAILESDRNLGC